MLIKIVGYIDTDTLRPKQVNLDHPTGLSQAGLDALVAGKLGARLMDVEVVEAILGQE